MGEQINNPALAEYIRWKNLPIDRKNLIRNDLARQYMSTPTPVNLYKAAKAFFGGYDPKNSKLVTGMPPELLPTPDASWRTFEVIGGANKVIRGADEAVKDFRLADYLVGMANDIKEAAPSFAKFVNLDPENAAKAFSKISYNKWILHNWREIPEMLESWGKSQLPKVTVKSTRGVVTPRIITEDAVGKGTLNYSTFDKPVDYMDRSIKTKPMSDRQWGGWGEDSQWGTYIDRIVDGFKKGGSIHIKPENKGKFTSYCGGKVTLECINKGKNSSNPAIRKRATFALNSKRWSKKHRSGGLIILLFKTYRLLNSLLNNV